MKSLTRLIAGLLSSLFLSAGLSHAATWLDPLNVPSRNTDTRTELTPGTPCALPSYYMPPQGSRDVRTFGT